jgi:hypothetical protein
MMSTDEHCSRPCLRQAARSLGYKHVIKVTVGMCNWMTALAKSRHLPGTNRSLHSARHADHLPAALQRLPASTPHMLHCHRHWDCRCWSAAHAVRLPHVAAWPVASQPRQLRQQVP